MKVWNGTAFVDPSSFKVWNGTAFVDPELYTWNGSGYHKLWPTITDHVEYVSHAAVSMANSDSSSGLTCPIPSGTNIGDRVFLFLYQASVIGFEPSGWTQLISSTRVGPSGTDGTGTGPRYMAIYYRNRDSAWSAPSFTSAATRVAHTLTLRRSNPDTQWGTPTVSAVATDWTTSSGFSASTSSFGTHSGGYLMAPTVWNDDVNLSASGRSLTQDSSELLDDSFVTVNSGSSSGTRRYIGAAVFHGAVDDGVSAPVSLSFSYNGSSQGGFVAVEQALQ
ncbi:hypothetical protein SEA_LATRETIUM_25 [Mycobacterium phage Latretium]|nr:hypothetical protein SEA_LATRETIUM_25 [Mycobacterium phage Latretium]